MTWLAGVALLAVALGAIVVGADWLTDGIVATAARLRVSAFAVASVVSGLELENIAAGIAANLAGFPGAALGTQLGGAVFLALAVAGLGGILAPVQWRPPAAALGWIVASPAPLFLLALDGTVSRLDGAILVVWFAAATWGLVRSGGEAGEPPDGDDDEAGGLHPVVRMAGGVVLVALGGDLLSGALRDLATRLPLGPTLLGNTALAAVVEAEEVIRVARPARRGRGDVAIASIGGTVVHFVSLNAGIIALVRPLPIDAATHALYLPAAVVAPAACFMLIAARGGLDRAAGVALLLGYVAFVALALAMGSGL